MLVYVAPVLDIGLYCRRLFKKSNSYKEEKKGDIIKYMEKISVSIDINYSCFIFLYSIIMAFQLTMKSNLILIQLQILLNARTVAKPLKFKSIQVILIFIFHHPLFQIMLWKQCGNVGHAIKSSQRIRTKMKMIIF